MNVSFLLLYLGNLIDIQKMCWFLERGFPFMTRIEVTQDSDAFLIKTRSVSALNKLVVNIGLWDTIARGERDEMKYLSLSAEDQSKNLLQFFFPLLICSVARDEYTHTGIQSLIILFIQFIHSLKYYILLLHTTQISAMINSEEGIIWRVFWFLCVFVCVML